MCIGTYYHASILQINIICYNYQLMTTPFGVTQQKYSPLILCLLVHFMHLSIYFYIN